MATSSQTKNTSSGTAVPKDGIKVLIPIDSSQLSKEAIDFYMNSLHRSNNKILLLHVVELPNIIHAGTMSLTANSLAEKWNEECIKGQQLLDQSVDLLKSMGATEVTSRLDNGLKPGHVVVSVTTEEDINLVVMGTRGSGLIRRTVLGSVSDYVINHAHCPVAVCRPPHEKKQ